MTTTKGHTSARCKFCGKELAPRLVELSFGSVFAGHEECDCTAAQAERLQQARAREEDYRAQLRKELRDMHVRAGIAERYLDADHPRKGECIEAVERGMNVYVFGDVGTTKTTLVSAAVMGIVDKGVRVWSDGYVSNDGKSVKHTSMRNILDLIKEGFRTGYDPLPNYASVDVLSLDDLGKEAPTAFALERLFALIDDRYNRMLPTIVTTQYKPGELIARLSENGDKETAKAIVSRLCENCLKVELDGPDRRRGNVA